MNPAPTQSLRVSNLHIALGGKKILAGISEVFEAGSTTAILGPSGSGKSTLLKSLVSIHEPDTGSITFNDMKVSKDKLAYRKKLAYVPQDDIVHKELDIQSALEYAAQLRLPPQVEKKEIDAQIHNVLTSLRLEAHRHKKIKRISGGQRKRVSIAMELLADPLLLFLDEPASGLDPATEKSLLQLLAFIKQKGCIVILTSHSMEFLHLMDKIVVLANRQKVFSGDLPAMLQFFEIEHAGQVFESLQNKHYPRFSD